VPSVTKPNLGVTDADLAIAPNSNTTT